MGPRRRGLRRGAPIKMSAVTTAETTVTAIVATSSPAGNGTLLLSRQPQKARGTVRTATKAGVPGTPYSILVASRGRARFPVFAGRLLREVLKDAALVITELWRTKTTATVFIRVPRISSRQSG